MGFDRNKGRISRCAALVFYVGQLTSYGSRDTLIRLRPDVSRRFLQVLQSIAAHLVLPAHIHELAQVSGKQQIERPVQRHAKFLFQPRQFAQVDRSPHPPGKESRHIEAENICHARAMSYAGKLPDRLEVELLELAAFGVSENILRNHLALPQSMLRGGRTDLAIAQIRNDYTVAQCPYSRPVRYSELRCDFQVTAVCWTRQRPNQRMRHRARGPDQHPAGNLPAMWFFPPGCGLVLALVGDLSAAITAKIWKRRACSG